MSFSKAWVETDPDGTQIVVAQLDNYQRDTKIAIRERLEGDPADPLTGLIETGSFTTAPKPRKGTARVYIGGQTSIASWAREDGRLFITNDAGTSDPRLYSLETAAFREIAYVNLDGSRAMVGDLTLNSPKNLIVTGRFETKANGDVTIAGGGLAAGAIGGFMFIPTINSPPTGVPSAYSGWRAMCFDLTNNKLWVYNSAWKGVVLT